MTTENPDRKPPIPERELTDESLRVEREKADDVLQLRVADLEETADGIINKARARADAVLAASRAKTDGQTLASNAQASGRLEAKRAREDEAVRDERAEADATVRAERAEHNALLSSERDETDKDLLTERVRSDDAVATRDEFLGIVSHDLRNLLGSVLTFAEFIARDAMREDRREQVLGHAQRIRRSGGRMNRLIGDLLDVASIEAGVLAVTREDGDPAQVVAEAMEMFQAQAASGGISLVVDVQRQSTPVMFDPARILQVLTNLLSNAIKFTPPKGRVGIHVERIGDELRFAVSDTGAGIPADKLGVVFERFRQVKTNDRRGLGLGLYISKCIVQGHGGRIWAESTIGEGSTFSFALPLGPAA